LAQRVQIIFELRTLYCVRQCMLSDDRVQPLTAHVGTIGHTCIGT